MRVAPARCHVVPVRAMADDGNEDNKKKPKIRMPSAVKRAKLAKERRSYNRARKSACATRIKKVRLMLHGAYFHCLIMHIMFVMKSSLRRCSGGKADWCYDGGRANGG